MFRLVYLELVQGLNRTKDKLCHSDKRRNLRKKKRRFSLFTLSLSKGSIGQKKAMSFRQRRNLNINKRCFGLFTLGLSKGSIRQKKAMSFRQKKESQKKQE